MEKIRAKKSLGQNFLRSKKALDSIIEAGDIKNTDTILEIGPGEGILTKRLLEKAGHVVAIEKDNRLISGLRAQFVQEISDRKLELIEADILSYKLQVTNYKLIANIPYYVTGEIIRKFLESENQPEKIVLLLQKEVAQRIVARDKKESILSLSVKIYGEPRYVATVQKESFSPKPKVDSAILSISNISKTNFKNTTEERFFSIVKAGFAQKRKKLINNLQKIALKDILEKVFRELNLDQNTRAEDMSLELWLKLTESLN